MKNPHLGFAKTLEFFQNDKIPQGVIHSTAIFNNSVKLGKNVTTG